MSPASIASAMPSAHCFGCCRAFIGQGAGGKSGAGMSQKEQKEVLQGFRCAGWQLIVTILPSAAAAPALHLLLPHASDQRLSTSAAFL